MNKEQALRFLREHQPMPPDEKWTAELADRYDEVRKCFIAHPDPTCIPLFLNAYGERDGLGVYQLVDEVFLQYDAKEVVPHLIETLASQYRSVRYWTAQICLHFPDERLIPAVINALKDSDEDIRCFCYYTLERILEATQYDYWAQLTPIFDEGLATESDPELIEQLKEIKDNIKKNGC